MTFGAFTSGSVTDLRVSLLYAVWQRSREQFPYFAWCYPVVLKTILFLANMWKLRKKIDHMYVHIYTFWSVQLNCTNPTCLHPCRIHALLVPVTLWETVKSGNQVSTLPFSFSWLSWLFWVSGVFMWTLGPTCWFLSPNLENWLLRGTWMSRPTRGMLLFKQFTSFKP